MMEIAALLQILPQLVQLGLQVAAEFHGKPTSQLTSEDILAAAKALKIVDAAQAIAAGEAEAQGTVAPQQ